MKTYSEQEVYAASIIDQLLVKNAAGEVQLVLTAKTGAKLKNPKNLADGTEPCSPRECQVLVTFANDDSRFSMALRDLERLGFVDDDISRLHPDNADFISFVGKEVFVRRRDVDEVEFWNLFWPRETLTGEQLHTAASSLKKRIAAVRRPPSGDGKVKKQSGKSVTGKRSSSPAGK